MCRFVVLSHLINVIISWSAGEEDGVIYWVDVCRQDTRIATFENHSTATLQGQYWNVSQSGGRVWMGLLIRETFQAGSQSFSPSSRAPLICCTAGGHTVINIGVEVKWRGGDRQTQSVRGLLFENCGPFSTHRSTRVRGAAYVFAHHVHIDKLNC